VPLDDRFPTATGASDRPARGSAPAPLRKLAAGLLLAAAALVMAAPATAVQPATGFARVSFGIKAGSAFSQHYGIEERDPEYEVSSRWRTSYAIAAFIHVPVTARFGMQQEVVYARKGSRQFIGVDVVDIPTVLDVRYEMDYLEIPILTRLVWLRTPGVDLYGLAGFAMGLKINDRYTLTGEVTDGEETVPVRADSDMSEVDLFDFSMVYGLGVEFPIRSMHLLLEYRFTLGWNTLAMPTYAYVPFDDEQILIDNDPVPLRNQSHAVMAGVRF
jgi:hypothetical protein